jgi:hypothetical protein
MNGDVTPKHFGTKVHCHDAARKSLLSDTKGALQEHGLHQRCAEQQAHFVRSDQGSIPYRA